MSKDDLGAASVPIDSVRVVCIKSSSITTPHLVGEPVRGSREESFRLRANSCEGFFLLSCTEGVVKPWVKNALFF